MYREPSMQMPRSIKYLEWGSAKPSDWLEQEWMPLEGKGRGGAGAKEQRQTGNSPLYHVEGLDLISDPSIAGFAY